MDRMGAKRVHGALPHTPPKDYRPYGILCKYEKRCPEDASPLADGVWGTGLPRPVHPVAALRGVILSRFGVIRVNWCKQRTCGNKRRVFLCGASQFLDCGAESVGIFLCDGR